MTSLEEEKRMLANWRGRRLMACRAVDTIDRVIESIGIEDGSELPPEGGLPSIPQNLRDEIANAAAVLLRMVLAANDGHISTQKVRRF